RITSASPKQSLMAADTPLWRDDVGVPWSSDGEARQSAVPGAGLPAPFSPLTWDARCHVGHVGATSAHTSAIKKHYAARGSASLPTWADVFRAQRSILLLPKLLCIEGEDRKTSATSAIRP